MSDGDQCAPQHGDHCAPQQQHAYHPQQPHQSSGDQYTNPQGYHPDHKTEAPHAEEKKGWLDDEKHRKEAEIAGGLAVGVAAIAGGVFAYKKHEEHKEEKRTENWAHSNWLEEAKARTAYFYQQGGGPANWVLNQGKNIPAGAIQVGREKSWTLYICRAFYEGGIIVGKASDVFKKGAVIGFKDKEIHLDTYEILVGNMQGLRWVSAHGRLNLAALGARPVEGGRDPDGTPIYIAKAPHKGAEHPGKASERLDGALIPYDGGEKLIKEYQVLCYYN